MTGPVRPPRARDSSKPPRPSNAWILYRCDKSRQLPAGVGSQQSNVSKTIAQQWRDESPEVRAIYERRAEIQKAEHALRYPNYRFQPRSKDEKARDRLEKKQAKNMERQNKRGNRGHPASSQPTAAPTSTPIAALPYPLIPAYYPDARYGSQGPSPPVSAAASPSETGHYIEANEGQTPSFDYAAAHAELLRGSNEGSPGILSTPSNDVDSISNMVQHDAAPNDANAILNVSQQSVAPSAAPVSSQPASGTWEFLQQLYGTGGFQYPSADPEQQWQSGPQEDAGTPTTSDHLSVDLQNPMMQNTSLWANFENTVDALLSATSNPNIFQLTEEFNPTDLTSQPESALAVSLGDAVHHNFFPDFSGYTLGGDDAGPSSQQLETHLTGNTMDPFDFSSYFTGHSGQALSAEFSNYNADDYINFDGASTSASTNANDDARPIVTSHQPAETQQSTPYVPPAGAMYSSTRRVAGSWKPSFAMPESPIDVSPPRVAYGVHA